MSMTMLVRRIHGSDDNEKKDLNTVNEEDQERSRDRKGEKRKKDVDFSSARIFR